MKTSNNSFGFGDRGGGFRNIAVRIVSMAVVAPMPAASDTIATTHMIGYFCMRRRAFRKSRSILRPLSLDRLLMSRYGITYTDITLKDHNEPGGCPLNFDQIVQPGITERTMSVPDKREIPIVKCSGGKLPNQRAPFVRSTFDWA